MRSFSRSAAVVALLALCTVGLLAQDAQPQSPAPAATAPIPQAAPPPPPQPPAVATQAVEPPKPTPTFQEFFDIDACLSATQVQDGTVPICSSPNGVTVLAGLQKGVLVSLKFSDGVGHSSMFQVRPDPIPMGRCWKCTSSPASGFSCTRTKCESKAATPAPQPQPQKK